MQKLKRGDEVIVITGRDRGKRGEIIRVLPKENRIFVKGVNLCKKHVKPNPSLNENGGIVIWNAMTGCGDRVGIKAFEAGKKVRIFKSNGERVDQ
jgi:large subunit ribosomal protein L24